MTVPPRVEAIYRALWQQHQDLARGDDDQRRALTLMIAQQVNFELGPEWGTKRADPGRPVSKDAIAYRRSDARLLYFDWQNGATREPNPAGEMGDITGQVFVPVEPVNHLRVGESPGSPSPTPGTTPTPALPATEPELDLAGLLDGIDRLVHGLAETTAAIVDLNTRIDKLQKDGVRLRLR